MPFLFRRNKDPPGTEGRALSRFSKKIPERLGYQQADGSRRPSSCSSPAVDPIPSPTNPQSRQPATPTLATTITRTATPEQLEPLGGQHFQRTPDTDETSSFAGSVVNLTAPRQSRYPARQYPGNAQAIPGYFANASNCVLQNPVMVLNYHDNEQAMRSLASHTIRGAEFDSSVRDPPPKCHPGTRKSILESAQRWLRDAARQKRTLWFVGSAGAGKSAIMQTLAEFASESPSFILGATLFFSRPNGRNNPSQVFITIAYQVAIRHLLYREFVLREFAADPDLPGKAMKTQFSRLIVEPFVRQGIYTGHHDLLIFLDGLDEVEGTRTQCEIVNLISSFSLTYPNVPLVWIIASRPESHLQSIFTRENISTEEVPMDSHEACADVEHYLREEFERIRKDDPVTRSLPQWPTKTELLTITAAAAGLFAFASTAIKFIDDPIHRNRVSGLALLIAAIKKISLQSSKGRAHPLTHLDALYTCILSQVPESLLPDTLVILTNHLVLQNGPSRRDQEGLVFLCNWCGMTTADAYGALDRLHSILTIPSPEEAERKQLSVHHQSFYEYLKDPSRSHRFYISVAEMDKQEVRCCLRIVKEAHSCAATEDREDVPNSNVILSWPTVLHKGLQRALSRRAVWSFAGIVGRYDPELVLSMLQDSHMTKIARTLNFIGSRCIFGCDPRDYVWFMHFVQHRLDARIRVELQRLKLLQEVPFRTLDLDNIEKERLTYIRCECDDFDGNTPNKKGISDRWSRPEPVDYDSEYKYWRFTRCAPLPRSALRDLQLAQAHSPDTPVLLFGNLTQMRLIYGFKTPDGSQRWTYYVPYRFPKRALLRSCS